MHARCAIEHREDASVEDEVMSVLSILCGIQASGKSTFYESFMDGSNVRISKDLMGGKKDKEERMLSDVCDELAAGKNVVVDNTNVDRESRARLVEIARMNGAEVACYYFPPHVDQCLKRNDARDGKKKVPVAAVLAFYKRLEEPSWDEGFDSMYEVEIYGDLRPGAGRTFRVTRMLKAD